MDTSEAPKDSSAWKEAWKVYERQPIEQPVIQPTISVYKDGVMQLNIPAWEMVGSPHYVRLFHNEATGYVGMRAEPTGDVNTFEVKAPHPSFRRVSATKFLREVGIDLRLSRTFNASLVEDVAPPMLYFDPQAPTRVGKPRKKRKKKEK